MLRGRKEGRGEEGTGKEKSLLLALRSEKKKAGASYNRRLRKTCKKVGGPPRKIRRADKRQGSFSAYPNSGSHARGAREEKTITERRAWGKPPRREVHRFTND